MQSNSGIYRKYSFLTPFHNRHRQVAADAIYLSDVTNIDRTGNRDASGKLLEVVSAVSADYIVLVVDDGTYKVSSDVTFPANIAVRSHISGVFSLDAGATMTVNGLVQDSKHQIWSGDGDVNFGKYQTLHVEAFGLVASEDADNDTRFEKLSASLNANGGAVLFSQGVYGIDGPVLYRSNQRWVFENNASLKLMDGAQENLQRTFGGTSLVGMIQPETTEVSDVIFESLRVDGNKANNDDTARGNALDIADAYNIRVGGGTFDDVPRNCIDIDNRGGVAVPTNISLSDIICRDTGVNGINGGNGLAIIAGNNIRVNNITVLRSIGDAGHGIDIETNSGDPADTVYDVIITHGRCSGNLNDGVSIVAGSQSSVRAVRVNDVYCDGNGRRGFSVDPTSTNVLTDIKFSGCEAYRNVEDGFYMKQLERGVVEFCSAIENGQGDPTKSGITLHRTAIRIKGNTCVDGQGSPTQSYGIEELAGSNNNWLEGNYVNGGHVNGKYNLVGADTFQADIGEAAVLGDTLGVWTAKRLLANWATGGSAALVVDKTDGSINGATPIAYFRNDGTSVVVIQEGNAADEVANVPFAVGQASGVSAITKGNVGLGMSTAPVHMLDLAGSLGLPRREVTTGATTTTTDTDVLIEIDTVSLAGGMTVTLLDAQTTAKRVVVVGDLTGSASSKNITIEGESGQTINGGASHVISTDYGWVLLVCDGSNWVVRGGGT